MMAGQANPLAYQREPSAAARYTDLRDLDPGATERSLRDNRPGPLGAPINTAPRRYDSKTGWVDSPPTPFRLDFSGQGLEPTFDPLASPDATLADRQAAEDFLYSLTPEQRARFGPSGGDGSVFSEEQITAVINARRGRFDPQRAFPTTVTETEVEAITPGYDPANPALIAGSEVPSLSMDARLARNLELDRNVALNQAKLGALAGDTQSALASMLGDTPPPDASSAPDMSGGRQGLRASQGAGAPSAGKDAGLLGTGTQGEGAPPPGGMGGMSLASGIIGGVGIAGAIANTITDFRTTAALEDMLADSAAGNTVARQEAQLMGGQLQRNIMASSRGRRDISPALALRNAQQAAAPAMSDMYGQAAIESARERRESEARLAQLRKQRYDSLFGSLMQTAGTVGSMLATQGANKETEDMRKRMEALERRALVDVTTPGRRPGGG